MFIVFVIVSRELQMSSDLMIWFLLLRILKQALYLCYLYVFFKRAVRSKMKYFRLCLSYKRPKRDLSQNDKD